MDLIRDSGQPRYGRFKEIPSAISLSRYVYRSPFGKVEKGWRRRLKYKKFKFCYIQHDYYSMGLAIADLAWVGHAFVYIYDHVNQQVTEWNGIQLLARKTHVDEQPLFNQSYFYKAPLEIEMQHANGVRYVQVNKYGEIKLSARIFCAGTEALSLCSPNGINGWSYTQKKTTLAVEGYFMNHKNQQIEFNDKSFAALDDTCGFLRPEIAWLWLSCGFWDAQGRRIGINLASGVNESFGNENCLWVNGRLYPLMDVLFERIQEHCWHIRSLDEKLQLEVMTGWRHYENINLRMVGSQFSQWPAKVTGQIQLGSDEIIQLDREYALLEQHYAKW